MMQKSVGWTQNNCMHIFVDCGGNAKTCAATGSSDFTNCKSGFFNHERQRLLLDGPQLGGPVELAVLMD